MNPKAALMKILSQITRPIYGGVGTILMLHRVTKVPTKRVAGQSRLEMDPGRLEEIIRFFQVRNYDCISPDKLPNRLSKPDRQRKFVLFTFDDGYLDNLTNAYPIFQEYNVPFTIYVATSFPEGNAVLWWYLLDDLILAYDHLSFNLPEGRMEIDCSTPEMKTTASRDLRGRIKYASPEAFHKIIDSVCKPYQIDLYAKTRELALNWNQIRELDRDPLVTIGSHSMHHFPLQVLGQEEARREIEQSKAILEERLGHAVNHFAYPFGERREAGPRDFELVRRSGYLTAVTTRFANLFPGHSHHLEGLPRFDVPALDSDEKMEFALNGLLQIRRNRFRRVVVA